MKTNATRTVRMLCWMVNAVSAIATWLLQTVIGAGDVFFDVDSAS